MFEITVKPSSGVPQRFYFDKRTVMIGRALGNDVRIDSAGASRYHARLSVKNGEIIVTDLNSSNGTFVENEKITERVITPEDQIVIGAVKLFATYVESGRRKPTVEVQRAGEAIAASEKSFSVNATEPAEPEVIIDPDIRHEAHSAEDTNGFGFSEPSATIDVEKKPRISNLSSILEPVWSFIEDEDVASVLINSDHGVFIEKSGEKYEAEVILTESEVKAVTAKVIEELGITLENDSPMVEGTFSDGFSVSIFFPPMCRTGICVVLRRSPLSGLSLEKMVQNQVLSGHMALFLFASLSLRKNIVISGAKRHHRMSLLSAMGESMPDDECVLSLEDSGFLSIDKAHKISMTRPSSGEPFSIQQLCSAITPDRVLVVELFGQELYDMLVLMNTSDAGVISTIQCRSPLGAIREFQKVMANGHADDRNFIANGIDLIVHLEEFEEWGTKVSKISEVTRSPNTSEVMVVDIFGFGISNDDHTLEPAFYRTEVIPQIVEEFSRYGLAEAAEIFSLRG